MKDRITEKQCKDLYIKYNTPERVIGHCKAVSDTAVKIAQALNNHGKTLDIPLIRGAGLAHDVARTEEEHGQVGALILESLGFEDEAEIVRVHMFYNFNSFDNLNETDLVCLGDRLVKEDKYVGLSDRINYIINKAGNDPVITKRILMKKEETQKLIDRIEAEIGQSIDSLCMKGIEK